MLPDHDPTQLYHRPLSTRRASQIRDPKQIGTFEVLERIGKGGMGVVYKARDTRLKRFVAIKTMLAAEHAEQEELDRFHLEAEAVARLRHPNIVQIFEVGEHEELPYIALEFIDGPTLTTFVQGEPQSPRFAAELVESRATIVEGFGDDLFEVFGKGAGAALRLGERSCRRVEAISEWRADTGATS